MSLVKYSIIILLLFLIVGCGRENAQQQTVPEVKEPVTQPETQLTVPEAEPQKVTPAPEKSIERQQERIRTEPTQPGATRTAAETTRKAAPESRAETGPVMPPVETPHVQGESPAQIIEQVKEPETKMVTIPSGTILKVRLQNPLDSATNLTGETFNAILDQDIAVNGIAVARRGSVLEGKLSNVERSGRIEGRAAMSMHLISLNINGQVYPLQTAILSFQAESTRAKDAGKVGIGAGIGAALGAILGGGRGAAIGAAAGAGAGGATVAATRGEELKFPAEHTFDFELQGDLVVSTVLR
ncbi:MAG TPA: hypothetical protein VLL97_11025 [Acidobacteriota bacterium]|nr:hypothetical protein [Acidobacteriota bacterium]